MYPAPSTVYFELLNIMKAFLKVRYPGKIVSTELNEDDTPVAVLVYGIGEHGFIRFSLDLDNYNNIVD